jgi:hypothetical protein
MASSVISRPLIGAAILGVSELSFGIPAPGDHFPCASEPANLTGRKAAEHIPASMFLLEKSVSINSTPLICLRFARSSPP